MLGRQDHVFLARGFRDGNPSLRIEPCWVELLVEMIVDINRNRPLVGMRRIRVGTRPANLRPLEADRSPVEEEAEASLAPPRETGVALGGCFGDRFTGPGRQADQTGRGQHGDEAETLGHYSGFLCRRSSPSSLDPEPSLAPNWVNSSATVFDSYCTCGDGANLGVCSAGGFRYHVLNRGLIPTLQARVT